MGKNKPKTKGEVEISKERIKSSRTVKIADQICGVVKTLITAAGWVASVYLSAEAIEVSLGKISAYRDVIIEIIKAPIGLVLPWIICAMAIFAYWNESRMRKAIVLEHTQYSKQLEKIIDSKRSSSHLLPDGSPRKEDQDD